MKGQKRPFRVISLILALALVLAMLPTTALAARTIDAGVFKNMQLYDVTNQRPISTYYFQDLDKADYDCKILCPYAEALPGLAGHLS